MFHETLNFAATKKLKMLFVCENNLYSVYSPLKVRQPTNRSLSDLAEGHGIKTSFVNGNDLEAVIRVSSDIIDYIKFENKPAFFELETYRWLEHCGPNYDNNIGYRSEKEFRSWKKKDPIQTYLSKNRISGLDVIEEKIKKEVDKFRRRVRLYGWRHSRPTLTQARGNKMVAKVRSFFSTLTETPFKPFTLACDIAVWIMAIGAGIWVVKNVAVFMLHVNGFI